MFDNIEERFDMFAGSQEVRQVILLICLLLIVSETVWDLLTKRRRGVKETFANFAIALGNALLERTLYGAVFILGLVVTEAFSPFAIPVTWWSWILAFVLADFTYYWMHRWEHEVRILWAHHSVHHSSPEFNLTTSLRLAWIEGLVEWVFFMPMVLIGFDVVQTIIALSFVVAYQTWIHTEKVGKLGWLDGILNTPSVHRVHHASNATYLDKNYGGFLILWDRLFGTYQAEEEKVVYGITQPLGTANPLTINFHEYWKIGQDIAHSKNASEAWGYMFKRPGWKPKNHEPESLEQTQKHNEPLDE